MPPNVDLPRQGSGKTRCKHLKMPRCQSESWFQNREAVITMSQQLNARARTLTPSLSLCLVLCMCTLCNIVVTIDYACVIYIIYVSCCRFSFEWTDRLSKHVMTSLLWELWSLPGPNSQWRCRRRLRHIDHECSGRYAALAWRNFSVSSAGQDDVASY